MENYYSRYDWETMLKANPPGQYSVSEYHNILCPNRPQFLDRYLKLPLLKRLEGVGLLCGTDWTPLYKNRFYYSRLDHSLGVALIIWNFTQDKAQTIAGLLHDVSTPVFSHVSDFRKGDALTQTATEEDNLSLVRSDRELARLLQEDGLTIEQVEDYHKYPVADNEIPKLSADRLEYMYPSGMALDGSWTLETIKQTYQNLRVLKNEDGIDELGFTDTDLALEYCHHFCMIGHILQLNENKLTLHMLGQIMNMAVEQGVLCEQDFMNKSESEIMDKLDFAVPEPVEGPLHHFARLYHTFRTMTRIEHTDNPLPAEDYFCVSLKVKQRYINPLVADGKRLYDCSAQARTLIDDFLSYSDTSYGCVRLVNSTKH
ncbi:MAG: hypothetical protein J5726_04135 [Treponema sp.]|nr:hypothetical protein [Treponema sp.]